MFLKSAFALAAALITYNVYVFFVTPSLAVTSTLISVLPTPSIIALDAFPLITAVPFTFTFDLTSATVGVNVRLSTLYATDTK
ncbi:hypothetical protein D3C73_787580 [compost metagenome]